MADNERWLDTDEAEDVAASIRHVLRCWPLASDDPQVWKWIALALHSALQGGCVCHLTTTASPIGAVTNKNAGEWIEYFEKSRDNKDLDPPGTYLLSLPELVKRVRRDDSIGSMEQRPGINITRAELKWLERFHKSIRNQFVHFEPQGWSIELSGMPGLAKLVGRIVGEMLDAGWAFRKKKGDWGDALRKDLALLEKLELT